jgi:hypothetical protein
VPQKVTKAKKFKYPPIENCICKSRHNFLASILKFLGLNFKNSKMEARYFRLLIYMKQKLTHISYEIQDSNRWEKIKAKNHNSVSFSGFFLSRYSEFSCDFRIFFFKFGIDGKGLLWNIQQKQVYVFGFFMFSV